MNLRTDVPHELPDTELKSKGRGAVKEALMQLRAEGYPVELPKEAAEDTDEEQLSAEAVREAYENSIEYRLGCEIMDGLTQSYGLSSEDAEAMLTGEYSPKSLKSSSSLSLNFLLFFLFLLTDRSIMRTIITITSITAIVPSAISLSVSSSISWAWRS